MPIGVEQPIASSGVDRGKLVSGLHPASNDFLSIRKKAPSRMNCNIYSMLQIVNVKSKGVTDADAVPNTPFI